MNNILIFDTTLRDGEQAPGAAMTVEEKVRIARVLADLKVDVIEAGFPISSEGSFRAVKEIVDLIKNNDKWNSTICGLARAKESDIMSAAEALRGAKRSRIHTFIATSEIHMLHKLKMDKNQVLDAIKFSVSLAKKHADEVEWSAEDATRTDKDFLRKCIDIAIQNGATIINIPDTVGYTIPTEYVNLIRHIKNSVVNIDKAIISVHCHNDLGLAVANSLSAVLNGAGQVECTINGLGERAGNASLEEIVMALKVRRDVFNTSTNIDATHILKASKLVSAITGFAVQPNKAIVGANAFVHESGIHQDGVLKNRSTYEILNPSDIGLEVNNIVLGKTSGRNALKNKLSALGCSDVEGNNFEDIFATFKLLCDKKKNVKDEDILSIINELKSNKTATNNSLQPISLKSFATSSDISESGSICSSNIVFNVNDSKITISIGGDGPIDCLFKAINQVFLTYYHNLKKKELTQKAAVEKDDVKDLIILDDYNVSSLTSETDAIARATVRLKNAESGITSTATSDDTDTIVASAKAYIKAMERFYAITK